jgi:hypothetical protein
VPVAACRKRRVRYVVSATHARLLLPTTTIIIIIIIMKTAILGSAHILRKVLT